MTANKWFLVVPVPLPAVMQKLLDDMPGWGRGPTTANAELLIVRRADLRDALVAAGAHRLPHISRIVGAIPTSVLTSLGKSTATGNVSDLLTQVFGDESWVE